jgi:hypothetical protein
MNNPKNRKSIREKEREMLPFFIEFVKFATSFAVIIALALLILTFVSTSGLR